MTDSQHYDPKLAGQHLANERTFLAWQRTSIATMGFGIIIARLKVASDALVPDTGIPIKDWHVGLVFVFLGLITVMLATRRYFSAQKAISKGEYSPTNTEIMVSTVITIFMGLFVVVFLTLVRH